MALTALAGCGDQMSLSIVEPLCTETPSNARTLPAMAGTWTGHGTFRQSWNAQTITVPVDLKVVFDATGTPANLPALGMIYPWRVSQGNAVSVGAAILTSSTVEASCQGEADGPPNHIELQPMSRCSSTSGFEWSYKAAFPFVDLLHYDLYGYTTSAAVAVIVNAHDAYRLSQDGAHLTLSGEASGADPDGNRPLALAVDGDLTRGEPAAPLSIRCALGTAP